MSSAYDTYNYPRYWQGRTYEHECEVIVLDSFFSKIGRVKSAVDIGGGYGRLIPEYKQYVDNVTLVDPSKRLLATAKKKGIECVCIQSSVEEIPGKLKKKKYDVALLVRVMHHLEDPQKALAILNSILKPGGHLIIEYANKTHGKAMFKNMLNGNFTFPLDIFPVDRRSKKNRNEACIPFLNHHHDIIDKAIKDNGFEILSKRSVSNIRSKDMKKRVSMDVLIFFERLLQRPLAQMHFGPSIFILARKSTKA
ncbi:hypothetical protein A2801_01670 [Candidatus Woesebacteria bacterium RIFCSPHIGHO2_01_FULL_41_10]|uniref:Methyltransferase type 11 domain-containing protein n=1 Tax=Candidatus Woesebacteria bacterium RIFCSPHIGHO2_01_FULL_41_10 TaxID=1802500 RepID=A0A1F7YS93_9BACT|nr:MAG: hypothetical protein A2801_01670 [Candidatus Woesebacteria bacterium RIFCSPHIGHO2_01_FULL_41_10]